MDDTCNPCVECSDKEIFNLKKVLIHVGLYMIPFLFLLIIWNRNYWLLLMIYLILAASHIIINCFSIFLKTKRVLALIIDQIIHIGVILVILKIFSFDYFINPKHQETLLIVLVLLLTIKPSAIFINNLYWDLFGSPIYKPFDTGVMIGIFERIIVLVLCYLNSASAIAIIIAAKSWVRSRELKEEENKEDKINKYLVGTLASICLALLYCAIYFYVMKKY